MNTASFFVSAAMLLAGMNSVSAYAQDHQGMDHDAMPNHDSHCGMPAGMGVINALDVKKSKINLTHQPIESIGWPQMRMDFAVSKPVDLAAFSAGEQVHFMLKAEKDKSYSIAMMCSLDADEGTHEACMAKMHDIAMKTAENAGISCPMGEMDGMQHMNHGDGAGNGESADNDHSGHH
jgi:Cu/Ag efflux protein CusF